MSTAEVLQPSEFLSSVVAKIPGWLHDFTALRTIEMMKFQEAASTSGPLLEIGVFRGRYFSIMLDSAIRTGADIFGIDTFQYVQEAVVQSGLRAFFGDNMSRVHLIRGASTEFDAAALLQLLGQKPRFISIDGSHDKEDVYLDLVLCDAVLANDGIIAVDDFLNPHAIDVNEAVHLYFQVPRRIAPFGYTPNKLFLCRPAQLERHRTMLHHSVLDDTTSPIAANYRKHPSARSLFGRSVVMVS